MFFDINNRYNTQSDLFKLQAYQTAKSIILLYPEKSTEVRLNNYLIKKYKLPLKIICLLILQNSTFTSDNKKNIIIIFNNPKWDYLAKLITYGTGSIPGSKILKRAFQG